MARLTEWQKTTAGEPARLGIPEDFFAHLYATAGRQFPWRKEEASPLGILLAEILLKQTHANQVAEVWPRLITRYGDAGQLAMARADELYGMIAILGFGKQRTKALIDVAESINQAGELPTEIEDLMRLPYVGVYTAHAVACFAFGRKVPVVDLSIVRTFSRIIGIEAPTDIRRAKSIWSFAWSLLPRDCFKEHNYGVLDFAALVCKPLSPNCDECPIVGECAYARKGATI